MRFISPMLHLWGFTGPLGPPLCRNFGFDNFPFCFRTNPHHEKYKVSMMSGSTLTIIEEIATQKSGQLGSLLYRMVMQCILLFAFYKIHIAMITLRLSGSYAITHTHIQPGHILRDFNY